MLHFTSTEIGWTLQRDNPCLYVKVVFGSHPHEACSDTESCVLG